MAQEELDEPDIEDLDAKFAYLHHDASYHDIKEEDSIQIVSKLVKWYDVHQRQLPWRVKGSNSPYGIWVSEVMSQQTRIETVVRYYSKWMEAFPTIQVLAEAAPEVNNLSSCNKLK